MTFSLNEKGKISGTKLPLVHLISVPVLNPINERSVSMMNKKILLVVSVSLLGWSLSQASITSVPTWSYSGGFYCYAPVLPPPIRRGSDGHSIKFWSHGRGHLTDSTTDPTLTINNSINNTSSFAWTEYVVNVAMNQSFSINSAGVMAPGGWTANITQPGAPVSGIYTGTIDYLGGTPVSIYPALTAHWTLVIKLPSAARRHTA